jgi:hypothetical protein
MAFVSELKAAYPSYGPDWDRAVELGVDVSLLDENLSLTPAQRLERLEQLLNEVEALRKARGDGRVP